MNLSTFKFVILLSFMATISTAAAADAEDKSDSVSVTDSTITDLSKPDIMILPVRTVQDILGLQSGTVELRPNRSYRPVINAQEVYARGGRIYETRYVVNGIDFTNRISGMMTATISPMAVERIDINQLGFAMNSFNSPGSAIVNIITKAGGEQFKFSAEAVTDNTIGSNFDQNWYSFSASGPVKMIDGLTFAGTFERRYLGDRNPSSETERILSPITNSDNPQRLPSNSQSGWSYHGRLDYDLSSKTKFAATLDGSTDEWQEYQHAWLFNIDHSPKYKDDNLGVRTTLEHEFSDKLEAKLAVSYFQSERLSGDGVLFDNLPGYLRYFTTPTGLDLLLTNPGLDDFNLFMTESEDQRFSWTIDTTVIYNADSSVVDTITRDTIDVSTDAIYGNYTHHKSSRLTIATDFKYEIGNSWLLKSGLSYSTEKLRYFNSLNATKVYDPQRLNRYGFDMTGEESDTLSFMNRAKEPSELRAFVQTSHIFATLNFTGGFRLRSINYDALIFNDPHDPFGSDGILSETDMSNAASHQLWEPYFKLRTTHSEKTELSFTFARNYIVPPANLIYMGFDFFLERVGAGSYTAFASTGIEPQQSTTFRFEFNKILSGNQIGLNLDVFRRTSTFQPTIDIVVPVIPKAYNQYNSTSESKTYGLGLNVWYAPTRQLHLAVDYTLQQSKGLSSDAYTNYINRWMGAIPSSVLVPLDTDQRHKFVLYGNLKFGKNEGLKLGDSYPFERTNLAVVTKLHSGLPYTRTNIYWAGSVVVSPEPFEITNSSRMDWQQTIDLKFEKTFEFGKTNVVWFVWVKNLLNKSNVQHVWSATGEPGSTAWLDTPAGYVTTENNTIPDETGLTYAQKYQLLENNPQHWGPPRQVYFGLRISM